jgi:hypothetical protein
MDQPSMLESLDALKRVEIICSHMRFTNTLFEGGTPALTTYYTCEAGDGGTKCDFSTVNADINEDVELRAHCALNLARTIVTMVEKLPEEFIPHRVDGFQLNRGGFELLRIQRKVGSVPATTGRIATIECSHLHGDVVKAMYKTGQDTLLEAAVNAVHRDTNVCCIQ